MLNIALVMLLAATAPRVEAVKAGDRTAAIALLAGRADVNAPEADGTTALHWAVHHNDLQLADRLIRADRVAAANAYGATPMSEAAVTAMRRSSSGCSAPERMQSRRTPTARRR